MEIISDCLLNTSNKNKWLMVPCCIDLVSSSSSSTNFPLITTSKQNLKKLWRNNEENRESWDFLFFLVVELSNTNDIIASLIAITPWHNIQPSWSWISVKLWILSSAQCLKVTNKNLIDCSHMKTFSILF